jgi:hypothetical protein
MTKRAVINQLRQPSTWRGIVLLCSAAGYGLRPELGEAVIAAGLAVSGLIGVLAGPDTASQVPAGE